MMTDTPVILNMIKNMTIKNRIVMMPMGTKDHRWNSGRKKYP